MKLCVFQGTFNPIHNAHLRVGNFVADKYDFDKILFIPAYIPPHKNFDINLSNHRYNMVSLAIENNKKFEVCDIEFKRKGKSYTYLTICELYEIYNIEGKINFLIGTDAFKEIESWYRAKDLKDLVDFIVFERESNFSINKFDYLKTKGYNFRIEKLSYNDISSTYIRECVNEGKNISNFLPEKVEEYIKINGLYKN